MSNASPASQTRPADVSDAAAATSAAPADASLAPYESDLVCDFFRQIGRLETAIRYEQDVRQAGERLLTTLTLPSTEKDARNATLDKLKTLLRTPGFENEGPLADLVGNAQNPLDHLVGDVIARSTVGRYFIIEFKRVAQGFAEEVDLKVGKPDRAALLGHLQADDDCRELSPRGHFGAHWTPEGLRLRSYLSLVTVDPRPATDVQEFFVNVMRDAESGWSAEELERYIDCMTSHGVQMETDSGKLVFGYFTQDAKFVAMTSSATTLAMIQAAFKRAAIATAHKNRLGM